MGFMTRTQTLATLAALLAGLAVAERSLERVAGAQTKAPSYQVDPMWPKLPKQWILGQVSGLDVDANDHVWIIQRPWSLNDDEKAQNPEAECCREAPPVMEFDAAGNYLQGWGGEGAGYEWPKDEHTIHIDYKGNVWISSAGGPRLRERTENQILKFTKAGKFLMQIGHRGQSKGSLDTSNFNNAADIYVYPKTNELFVADGYVNRRVIVLDPDTGAFKRMWGAYGNKPDDSAPNRLTDDGPAPQQFNTVHGIQVSDDGIVYVADRINNRIQLFTTAGKFLKQVRVTNTGSTVVPVPAGFAFSPDAAQQYLYVVDSGPMRVVVFDRQTMTQTGVVGMRGKGAGEFDIVHHMAADSKGNLYTAEIVNNRRAQRLVLRNAK